MVQLALSASIALLLSTAASQLVLAQMHHGANKSAQAPAAPALSLPAEPAQACALAVHRNASNCGQANYRQYSGSAEGPDEACCARAADFFGSSSPLASRNCYCDPDVLERLMAAEELADLSSTDFFDSCATIGIVIPYYTENKKGQATGICAGYEVEAGDEGHGEHGDDGHGGASDDAAAPPRSFGQWFRQLNFNPYLAVCMAVAMPSVLGFLLFLWPFVFAATASLHDLVRHSSMKGCPLAFGKAE